MDILIRGILGALIAMLLHVVANTRHHYLTGLIPLFPTFALFAHTMFASSGRTADLQASAQFGLLSLLPYGLYLLLTWWLSGRMNVWLALTLATAGWVTVAVLVIVVWNKGIAFFVNIFTTPSVIALIGVVGIFLVPILRFRNNVRQTGRTGVFTALSASRSWLVTSASIASITLIFFTAHLYPLQGHKNQPITASKVVAPTNEASYIDAELLQAAHQYRLALTSDPDNVSAQRGLQSIFSSYVKLAKSEEAASTPHLAANYLSRARAVLFGLQLSKSANP